MTEPVGEDRTDSSLLVQNWKWQKVGIIAKFIETAIDYILKVHRGFK